MRILVVGAGAIGGYFGGRLLQAGRDVTFLLRPRRAAQIDATGLVIQSNSGNVTLRPAPHVTADGLRSSFDVIVVSCKAYDLPETITSFAPAVGPATMILPLLNGYRHIDDLTASFGASRVLGGLCMISAVLDPSGSIVHFGEMQRLVFGELDGTSSERVRGLEPILTGATFDARLSTSIGQEMWEKWVFIAALAGINALMRASVGDIVAAGGEDLALGLYDECCAVARAHGHAPRDAAVGMARQILTMAGSPLTASLLKDIERGARTEGEHILGDLHRRGAEVPVETPLLRVAYAAVSAYEVRRAREARTT